MPKKKGTKFARNLGVPLARFPKVKSTVYRAKRRRKAKKKK